MNDITIILMVGAVLCYAATLLLARRKEVQWIAVIVEVCAICAMLIDESIATEHLLLLMVPAFFIFAMTSLKVMNILERW